MPEYSLTRRRELLAFRVTEALPDHALAMQPQSRDQRSRRTDSGRQEAWHHATARVEQPQVSRFARVRAPIRPNSNCHGQPVPAAPPVWTSMPSHVKPGPGLGARVHGGGSFFDEGSQPPNGMAQRKGVAGNAWWGSGQPRDRGWPPHAPDTAAASPTAAPQGDMCRQRHHGHGLGRIVPIPLIPVAGRTMPGLATLSLQICATTPPGSLRGSLADIGGTGRAGGVTAPCKWSQIAGPLVLRGSWAGPVDCWDTRAMFVPKVPLPGSAAEPRTAIAGPLSREAAVAWEMDERQCVACAGAGVVRFDGGAEECAGVVLLWMSRERDCPALEAALPRSQDEPRKLIQGSPHSMQTRQSSVLANVCTEYEMDIEPAMGGAL
ncbi:hypothetical protein ACCO45_005191 [Purpureocillium lilacinum]|uniref:Uncharacterized protein n=1 Tax=Purpureocillium lilacinum TaxID=33203 RepID=A0ACC4DWZ9_PURLI